MRVFKHLRSDWLRYGFETLAVVVGILAAFALENWNEERQARDQADIFLNHIAANIDEDLEQLKTPMAHVDKYETYHYENYAQSTRISDAFDIKDKYADDPREPYVVDEEKLVDDYKLEILVLIRLVHSETEKEIYQQRIDSAIKLRASIKLKLSKFDKTIFRTTNMH